MFAIRGEHSCGEFGRYMLSQRIAIRDLNGLPGCAPGSYRIGVRSHADNQRLVVAAAGYPGAAKP